MSGPSPRLGRATLTVADFPCSIAPPLDDSSCLQQSTGSPRVRRVTFAPSIRCIYARPVRMTLGFRSVGPFAHLTLASCSSCSSDQSFAYGFLPTPHRCDAAATLAKSSCHQGLQRTFTSKSLPASLSLHGYPAPLIGASRHAWRTKKKGRNEASRPFGFDAYPVTSTDRSARSSSEYSSPTAPGHCLQERSP